MSIIFKDRINRAWLTLLILTIVAWESGAEGTDVRRYATIAIIAIAFLKVRIIGQHFMELRTAPYALKWSFDTGVVVVMSALIAIYWATPTIN